MELCVCVYVCVGGEGGGVNYYVVQGTVENTKSYMQIIQLTLTE